MRRLLIILSMLVLPSLCFAEAEWLSRSFDFGAIPEEEGLSRGEFRFVNKGPESLIITKARTSCGCTQATYPKKQIAPGDTASILFSYDPYRRPGRFEKSIKVWVASTGRVVGSTPETQGEMTELKIFGRVIPGPETLSADYPIDGSGFKLQGRMVNLGEIHKGASRHGFLQIFNTGTEPVSLEFKSESEALDVKLIPDSIEPGEGGIISFCLDTAKEPRSGELKYRVEATNKEGKMQLQVWGTIEN